MVHCHTPLHRLKNTHTYSLVCFHSSGLYPKEEVIGVQQSKEQKHSVICQCSLDASAAMSLSDTHTHTKHSLTDNHTQLVYAHRCKLIHTHTAAADGIW